jgi:hypothetical protein
VEHKGAEDDVKFPFLKGQFLSGRGREPDLEPGSPGLKAIGRFGFHPKGLKEMGGRRIPDADRFEELQAARVTGHSWSQAIAYMKANKDWVDRRGWGQASALPENHPFKMSG